MLQHGLDGHFSKPILNKYEAIEMCVTGIGMA